MRNDYGRAVFATHRLSVPWGAGASPVDDLLRPLDALTGGAVSLGADLRTAYVYDRAAGGPAAVDAVFLMQADLYVSAKLGKWVTLYLDRGVFSGFEAMGILHVALGDGPPVEAAEAPPARGGPPRAPPIPAAAYLKVGHFVPAYGLKLPSHSAFVREPIGFLPATRETGLEAGLLRDPLAVNVGYFRGDLTRIGDLTPGSVVTATATLAFRSGLLKAFAGLSLYWQDRGPPAALVRFDPDGAPAGASEVRAGGFVGASLGRVTYLGELDVVRAEPADGSDGAAAVGYVSYQELSFVPYQGVDLQLTYEFKDANVRLADTGTTRVGAAAELFVFPFSELVLQYRYSLAPTESPERGRWDLVAMLHLFF